MRDNRKRYGKARKTSEQKREELLQLIRDNLGSAVVKKMDVDVIQGAPEEYEEQGQFRVDAARAAGKGE